MRRPLRRPTENEDGESPQEGGGSVSKQSPTPHHVGTSEPELVSLQPDAEQISVNDFASRHDRVRIQSPAIVNVHENIPRRGVNEERRPDVVPTTRAVSAMAARHAVLPERPALRPLSEQPVFKIPALPPALPNMADQENEPPPTFKRNKPSSGVLVQSDKSNVLPVKIINPLVDIARPKSPPRQALLPRTSIHHKEQLHLLQR